MARCDVPRLQCLHQHGRPTFRDPKPSGELLNGIPTSYRDLCPAHPDTEHSLGISVTDGKLKWNCFAGCDGLAVRDGLIRDGWHPDCLPISRNREKQLVDEITALYQRDIGHAERAWRTWSLIHGFGGELPPKGRYPGGRRGFCRDAGVSPADAYSRRK